MNKDLMLYIHIPFCVKKCDYCDFLSGPAKKHEIEEYVEVLCEEIKLHQEFAKDYLVDSIFFGGGTPSILTEAQITVIMNNLKKIFVIKQNAEITIECNPGTLSKSKFLSYKSIGINRLSFGLQSTENTELKLLGRIHSFEEFLENYRLAREAGFRNINIDLMSALPGQTLESYNATLEKIIALQPEHISAYSLIIEEGTPFHELYGEDGNLRKLIPSEDVDRDMYHKTKELLKAAGYNRYEISNYSKAGYECRHNLGYWRRKEYLGLGLGAASLLNGTRFRVIDQMKDYLINVKNQKVKKNNYFTKSEYENCDIYEKHNILSQSDEMEEFMFLGLRIMDGIYKNEFYSKFNIAIEEVYGDVLVKLVAEKMLETTDDCIKLTEFGIDISNYVFEFFLIS